MFKKVDPNKYTLEEREIDFRKITDKDFQGYDFTSIEVNPDSSGYVTNALLERINLGSTDTTILNFGVGTGKSTSIYELITRHVEAGDIVLVASPFKSLVTKDFSKLDTIGQTVSRYDRLPVNDLPTAIQSSIHVVTIKFLLGYPGEVSYEASSIKKRYLDGIIKRCQIEGKRLILFVDELHESSGVFTSDQIPYLFRIQGVISKCYVASATITESCVQAIRFMALLTNKKVVQFWANRMQFSELSPVDLYIFASNEGFDEVYTQLILGWIDTGEYNNIHVLQSYKSRAAALHRVINAVHPVRLVTSSGNTFHGESSNIGTTFKTGVNIESQEDLLVIVLPYMSRFTPDIYNDGAASIHQALARMRNGGRVVIMSIPILEAIEPVPQFLNQDKLTRIESYQGSDKWHGIVKLIYDKKVKEVQSEIGYLQEQINYSYPTLEQHLVTKSDVILKEKLVSYGKDLGGYTLWALLNNQFTNARLDNIYVSSTDEVLIDEQDEDLVIKLLRVLRSSTFDPEEAASADYPYQDLFISCFRGLEKGFPRRDGTIVHVVVIASGRSRSNYLSRRVALAMCNAIKRFIGANDVSELVIQDLFRQTVSFARKYESWLDDTLHHILNTIYNFTVGYLSTIAPDPDGNIFIENTIYDRDYLNQMDEGFGVLRDHGYLFKKEAININLPSPRDYSDKNKYAVSVLKKIAQSTGFIELQVTRKWIGGKSLRYHRVVSTGLPSECFPWLFERL